MAQLFLAAFSLGLTLSVTPGALNIESVRRGVNGGFWPALQVHVGALAGDGIWLLLALWGGTLATHHSFLPILFMLLGGLFFLWNAWQIAHLPRIQPYGAVVPSQRPHGLLIGAMLALSSPLTAAFGAGLQGMLLSTEHSKLAAPEMAVLCSAYMLSVLIWGAALSALAVCGSAMFIMRFGAGGRSVPACC
ncbi:MAG: LysE family transporter [Caldilineaceae bacterium]|nr:LysE family transporter [Caldilineaceae bacterium]MCB0141931.1 LysE family transporter [Caldilineaceae bacterium]